MNAFSISVKSTTKIIISASENVSRLIFSFLWNPECAERFHIKPEYRCRSVEGAISTLCSNASQSSSSPINVQNVDCAPLWLLSWNANQSACEKTAPWALCKLTARRRFQLKDTRQQSVIFHYPFCALHQKPTSLDTSMRPGVYIIWRQGK